MSLTKDTILNALKQIPDPELHRDIVTLGLVRHVSVCDGYVKVHVALDDPVSARRDTLDVDIRSVLEALDEPPQSIEVAFEKRGAKAAEGGGKAAAGSGAAAPTGQAAEGGAASASGEAKEGGEKSNPLPDVKRIIAVGAGKGGVGKSMIAVNLAVGLARAGLKVGVLDGDIYGPSLTTMLALDDLEPQVRGKDRILPFEVAGVRAMTLGKLVEPEKPLIWRGPMAHSAFRQLATQTEWGELDYLIIDLPPGTGDVPLTMSQLLPLSGAVVVCTPQKVAQDDARRAVRMFESLNVTLVGVVENMSYFIGDDGKEYDIFGRGGAQVMARDMNVPYLGMVPINMRLRTNGDRGTPLSNFEDDEQLGGQLETFVENFLERMAALEMTKGQDQPTLTVH